MFGRRDRKVGGKMVIHFLCLVEKKNGRKETVIYINLKSWPYSIKIKFFSIIFLIKDKHANHMLLQQMSLRSVSQISYGLVVNTIDIGLIY